MSSIPYTYGSFLLNDNRTYIVDAIDLSWNPITPATVKIARLPGMKKTGETTDDRKVNITISVVSPDGTRAGLRAALDALYGALYLRQQTLTFQDDGRYFIADCINVQTPVQHPNFAICQVEFRCYQPFAYGLTPQSASASAPITGSGPYLLATGITGGGTVFSYPLVTITNTGGVAISSLTLTNVTQNIGLTVATLSLNNGDFASIQCDPGAANSLGYTISKNGITSTFYDFTGMFPTQDPGLDAWLVSVVASGTPAFTAQWQWTIRWLA